MKKYLLYLFSILLLSACTDKSDKEDSAVSFNIKSVSSSEMITRASSTLTNGSIGVFCLPVNGYTAKSNVKYTYINSNWSNPSGKIYLDTSDATLYAYYPYGASGITSSTDITNMTLTSKQYSDTEDLQTSEVLTANQTMPNVNINMRHVYSKITFKITRKSNYPNACSISNIATSRDIISSAQYSIPERSGIGSRRFDPISYNPGISSIASGTTASTSMLAVPTEIMNTTTFTFTVDGVDRDVTLSYSQLHTLVAGTNYNIPITVTGTGLTVGTVQVADWDEQVAINGGNAQQPYAPPTNIQGESNCYIVAPNNTISIPISIINSGVAYAKKIGISDLNIPITPTWTSGIVWGGDCIKSISNDITDGYVTVTTSGQIGNALIYIKNSSNDIIWSWHIWVTDYNPNTQNVTVSGHTFMDRNLGAFDNGCIGLHYQYGRKDPFEGLQIYYINGNFGLDYCTKNPGTFVTGYSRDYAPGQAFTCGSCTWYYNLSATYSKTPFDPCPAGWTIPPPGDFDLDKTFVINNEWSSISVEGYGVVPVSMAMGLGYGLRMDADICVWCCNPFQPIYWGIKRSLLKTTNHVNEYVDIPGTFGLNIRCEKE